jgi:hypothetical protein
MLISTPAPAAAYEVTRADLSNTLLTWFASEVAPGISRKDVLSISKIELAVDDRGGNLRRWLTGGKVGGAPYVPTLSTLRKIEAFIVRLAGCYAANDK